MTKSALELDAAAFVRFLPRLLAEHPGKFVLIRAADQIKVLDTFDAALAEGYKRFKREPFFVKLIAPSEPAVFVSHGVEACRT